jgi:hypothetical protein
MVSEAVFACIASRFTLHFLRTSVSVSPDIGFTLARKAHRNDPVVMGRINVAGELNP